MTAPMSDGERARECGYSIFKDRRAMVIAQEIAVRAAKEAAGGPPTPHADLWERYVDLAKEKITPLLAEVRADQKERDAKVAGKSNFVDGPRGTIEGQIAAAIRALRGEG